MLSCMPTCYKKIRKRILILIIFVCPALLHAQKRLPQPFIDSVTSASKNAGSICGNDIALFQLRQNPTFKTREEKMNQEILNALSSLAPTSLTLPVVIHIINPAPNSITDIQIMDGVKLLNDAFSKSGIYSASAGADTKIRFCLAQKDPDGGNTTGITRTTSYFSDHLNMDIEDARLKNLIQWDPSRYINIWLITKIEAEAFASYSCGTWYRLGVGGYATMPPAGGTGDGIVITGFGALLAHEMGHYLGLYHTFEGGCYNYNCLTDGDRVCDTPPDGTVMPSAGCASPGNSCNSDTLSNYSNGNFYKDVPDQITNFMDYGNANCSNQFTQGQADRMWAAVITQRPGLLADECTKPCPDNIIANFTRSIDYSVIGNTINFTNTSTGATNYQWLVNDVLIAATTDFSYTFNAAAKDKITLRAFTTAGCFAASTAYVITNCGTTARFYTDKKLIASKAGIYTDSIIFTNNSYNGVSYQWLISNDKGMAEHVESSNTNITYVFPTPANYKIRLVATNGTCSDTTNYYMVTVMDPTPDGGPFNISLSCNGNNKVTVNFCLADYGYAPIPKNTPVSFYDADPRLPGAKKLSPTLYLPYGVPGGNCYVCFTHVLNVSYRGLEKVYLSFNDSGTVAPVVFPSTTFVESYYTNNIIFAQTLRTTIYSSICQGKNYYGHKTSGTYVDTIASVLNGCDSIRTLHLTVKPVATSTVNASICMGQNYAGHTSTGTFVDVYMAANGCDSTRTLNLTVKPVFKTSVSVSICEGQNYNGHTKSGTYVDTYLATNNCDSIRTIYLTVKSITRKTIIESICIGDNYAGHTKSGTYIDIYNGANGCDSIRTLELTVKPVYKTSVTTSVCPGQKYAGHSTSGTFVDNYTASNGCDSTRTLFLTVKPVIATTVNASICNGQNYAGHLTSGTFVDVYPAANGCDSTRTLNLIVKPVFKTSLTISICEGQNYFGHTTSGTYVDSYLATNKCDSIRTVYLKVKLFARTNIFDTICNGDNYAGHTKSGTYVDTYNGINGCDSIRTLQLTVKPVPRTNISASICIGENYAGHVASGTYVDRFTASNGCDSIRTLLLTLNTVKFTTFSTEICEGENYAGHTTAGTYVDIYRTSKGCDSSRTLYLKVRPARRSTITATICDGENYAGHTTAGNYKDVYTASNGCDSIRNLSLTVKPRSFTIVNKSICEGASYLAGGKLQKVMGIYADTLLNTLGCDSIITTNLSVNPIPNPKLGDDRGVCAGDKLILDPGNFVNYLWQDGSTQNSFTTSTVGRYSVTVSNNFNCKAADTINILRIDLLPQNFLGPDTSYCRGNLVHLNVKGYQNYLWSTGSKEASIDLVNAGTYRLNVIDFNGCKGADSIKINFHKCAVVWLPNAFTPNKDGMNEIFRPVFPSPVTDFKMQIWNRYGKQVFESTNYLMGWDGLYKSDLQPLGVYVYVITFRDIDGNKTMKKGIVTLVR